MNLFQPHIIPVYPPHNELIFEEWFAQKYTGCNTDRELLPFFPTSYWVNHDYGNDKLSYAQAVYHLNKLDKNKKYFIICQYDDGCLINFESLSLDVLQFNMSKNIGVSVPLLCQPHPYKFTTEKKWMANFVGGKTHPIRSNAERLMDWSGYYISYEQHEIEKYCRILHESVFTLCFRGYGASSFRIAEALQYGSIPVYISNEFIFPYDIDFNDFGVVVEEKDAHRIDEILKSIPPQEIVRKQNLLQGVYKKYYTYESNINLIIDELQAEYYTRKNSRKTESFIGGIIEAGD